MKPRITRVTAFLEFIGTIRGKKTAEDMIRYEIHNHRRAYFLTFASQIYSGYKYAS